MLRRLALGGNPNLGVYARATEKQAWVSYSATDSEVTQLREALEVPVTRLRVGGTNLVGALVAANSRGAVVCDILDPTEERVLLDAGLDVYRLDDPWNAAGNVLLVNDHGGIVGHVYPEEVHAQMEATLGVRLVQGTLGGLANVGMAGTATRRGVLVHPKATDEEREAARQALGCEVWPGTINHGTALIGAGLVANSRGAAIGQQTTGIEIGRIDEALGFLDAAHEQAAGSAHRTV